jgi:ABC-type nitrate/sulfonate/bicarbonate transport system substrate-binding protein
MSKPLEHLWYTHSPDPSGLGMAVDSGRLSEAFRPFGTQIQALRESPIREIRDAHYDHHLQYSVRHGGNIPAIWARASGQNTRVVGLSWSDEVQLLLTTQDSGIRQLKDLRNRRFGLPKWANVKIDLFRAQALRGLENALKLEGFAVEDVELVDYPYGSVHSEPVQQYFFGGRYLKQYGRLPQPRNQELIGLLRGDIDAIFVKGAHGLQLAQEFGLRLIVDLGSHADPLIRSNLGTPRVLSVDQKLLSDHPDAVIRLLDTVLRTEQWAWTHPDDAHRFIARALNTSEYWVAAAYGEDAHQHLHTALEPRAITALQDMTDFLARRGFIQQRFDVSDWIDPRPLQNLLNTHKVAL